MTPAQVIFGVSSLLFFAAALVNLRTVLRGMRDLRYHNEIRQVMFAYEKELLERGVTLPPRCVWCCQILPRHVEGCACAMDYLPPPVSLTEKLTRPPIKYYRDGSRPPDLEGK